MLRSIIGEQPAKNQPTPKEVFHPDFEIHIERDRTHDQIERRAYQIFLERGARHGDELDDWLRAERELERIALYVRSWNRLSILDGRQLLNFEDCVDGTFTW